MDEEGGGSDHSLTHSRGDLDTVNAIAFDPYDKGIAHDCLIYFYDMLAANLGWGGGL
jgi:hypothetical protein